MPMMCEVIGRRNETGEMGNERGHKLELELEYATELGWGRIGMAVGTMGERAAATVSVCDCLMLTKSVGRRRIREHDDDSSGAAMAMYWSLRFVTQRYALLFGIARCSRPD